MPEESSQATSGVGRWLAVVVAWALVGVPLLWGVSQTIKKAVLLFRLSP